MYILYILIYLLNILQFISTTFLDFIPDIKKKSEKDKKLNESNIKPSSSPEVNNKNLENEIKLLKDTIIMKENEIKKLKLEYDEKLNNNYNQIKILENKLNEEIIKNKKLKEENIKLKEAINNKYKIELDNIKNENNKLNKIIVSIVNNNGNNNELNKLKDENMKLYNQLLQKENEIKDLKLKYENNNEMFNMIVYFQSDDQVINKEPIRCKSTDTFAEIEEKLYKKYNDFRNTNNTPICNGASILRFKTLSENKIRDENVVLLYKIK